MKYSTEQYLHCNCKKNNGTICGNCCEYLSIVNTENHDDDCTCWDCSWDSITAEQG